MSHRAPRLRPATPADQAFLFDLTRRLAAFARPQWRTAAEIAAADHPLIAAALADPSPDTLILIAEDPGKSGVGAIVVTTAIDYFTRRRHAYVEVVAVTEAAAGRGIGRALLEAAEAWARDKGYDQIALSVFATNETARGVYERLDYQPEILRYRKALGPPTNR